MVTVQLQGALLIRLYDCRLVQLDGWPGQDEHQVVNELARATCVQEEREREREVRGESTSAASVYLYGSPTHSRRLPVVSTCQG